MATDDEHTAVDACPDWCLDLQAPRCETHRPDRVLVVMDLGYVRSPAVGRTYADLAQQAAGGLTHTAAYVLSGEDAAAVLELMLGPEKGRLG